MALGTSINFNSNILPNNLDHIVFPAQLCSGWTTMIEAGGMDGADNSGNDITNPTTSVTASDHKIVRVSDGANGAVGTTLLLRMGYDATTSTAGTLPVVELFGRKDSTDSWMRLYNKEATPAYNITMTTAPTTDISDGTLKYTKNDQLIHAFDLQGCNEILAAVKTAYAGSDGNEALAILQGKII